MANEICRFWFNVFRAQGCNNLETIHNEEGDYSRITYDLGTTRFSIYYKFITHAINTSEHALVKNISVLVISLKKANVHEANANSFISLLLNYAITPATS